MDELNRIINDGMNSLYTEPLKRLPSQIDTLNPMYYENHPEDFPAACIDHFDNTPRRIRCISDGSAELDYLDRGDGYFGINSPLSWVDLDDFTYYLDRLVRPVPLLTVGKEYTLTDAFPEQDVEFGMVMVEELKDQMPEGVPAFLFEETSPRNLEKRRDSIKKYWDRVDEELDREED